MVIKDEEGEEGIRSYISKLDSSKPRLDQRLPWATHASTRGSNGDFALTASLFFFARLHAIEKSPPWARGKYEGSADSSDQ